MDAHSTEWRYVIDELRIDQTDIRLRGWLTHPLLGESITNVQTVLAGDLVLPEKVAFGLSSPDVGKVLGGYGQNARFAADHVIPDYLSLESFKKGFLKLSLVDQTVVYLPFADAMETTLSSPLVKPLSELKIGLGITTFNRRKILEATLDCIDEFSNLSSDIFVADDGSTDGTLEFLKNRTDISFLLGKNRGIAWNKNRALFYLAMIRQCDVIILMEDDVQPSRAGWDIEWVLAAAAFGHVNFAPPWFMGHFGGTGRWHKPYRSAIVSGQCSAFTSEALTYVGYLDTRFGKYGHEHVEHTLRMIRAGYGGSQLVPKSRESYFLLVNGGLSVSESISSRNEKSLSENATVFEMIWDESIYRQPWRNDEEMMRLRAEMVEVTQNLI